MFNIFHSLEQKSYSLFSRPYEVNIIGIRATMAIPNSFADTMLVFYKGRDAGWTMKTYKATTTPGTYWLEHPMNPMGTAILQPGQYRDSHQLGLHRNAYRALIQRSPLTVIRDNDLDALPEITGGTIDTGMFGINIHHAGKTGTTKLVNTYSAGCQVLASVNDFNALIQMAETHRKRYGNSFTYTLLNEADLIE